MPRLLQFLFLLLLSLPLYAQQMPEQTNKGTDFWVTDVVTGGFDTVKSHFTWDYGQDLQHQKNYFAEHLHEPDDYADTAYILIVGNSSCSGYAENPNTGWHYDFTVEPDHITEIKVPEEEVMCYITRGIQSKGIYIHTDCPVYTYLITRTISEWPYPYYGYLPASPNYPPDSLFPYTITPQKFQIPPIQTGVTDVRLPVSIGLYKRHMPAYALCCHFPDYSNFLSLSYLIVAHEDNTEVFVPAHFEARGPMEGTSHDIIARQESVWLLQKGEVLVVPMLAPSGQGPVYMMDPPEERTVDIHTNCKKVSIFLHRTFHIYSPYGIHPGLFLSPKESFTAFHPDLFGKDLLFLQFASDVKYMGHIQSSHCDNTEDAPLWSNKTARLYDALDGFYHTFHESHCQCWPSMYYFEEADNFLAWKGIPKFMYNNNPLLPAEFIVLSAGVHSDHTSIPTFGYTVNTYHNLWAPVAQLPYADRQVKEALFPIQAYENRGEVALSISTSPTGRFTTYVNGELLPDSVFIIDDTLVGRYYITSILYENEIPEIIRVENENGFSAFVEEIRAYLPFRATNNNIECWYSTVMPYSSGCTYNLPSVRPSIGVGVSTFCANDTLRVYAEGNCENNPVTWTIGDSTFTSLDNDTLLFPLHFVDTLHITMIVDKYCPDTLIDTLYVVLHPHLTLPADTIICRGASITAQSDMFGFWQWSDGTASATFIPEEEGDHTVYLVNDCGTDSATIHVRFYEDPLYVDFGNDTLLCELATLLLDATQQHPASYLWQDASSNTTYTVINDGHYWVVVDDGCAGTSDTIDVTYLYDLQIDLGHDTTICSDRPYQLDVTTPFSHYLWHDGTTAPTHWVDVPGTYSVHVYNACTEAYASVTVEVEECREEVYVPNAFTPDGDGQNEMFLPVFNHPERVESYSLHVYDRWGRQLFGTGNLHQGWDGSGCPTGTYVWRMEYKAAGERPQLLTGSVTVVR